MESVVSDQICTYFFFFLFRCYEYFTYIVIWWCGDGIENVPGCMCFCVWVLREWGRERAIVWWWCAVAAAVFDIVNFPYRIMWHKELTMWSKVKRVEKKRRGGQMVHSMSTAAFIRNSTLFSFASVGRWQEQTKGAPSNVKHIESARCTGRLSALCNSRIMQLKITDKCFNFLCLTIDVVSSFVSIYLLFYCISRFEWRAVLKCKRSRWSMPIKANQVNLFVWDSLGCFAHRTANACPMYCATSQKIKNNK